MTGRALRLHYPHPNHPAPRLHPPCGETRAVAEQFTTDASRVTCVVCRRWIARWLGSTA